MSLQDYIEYAKRVSRDAPTELVGKLKGRKFKRPTKAQQEKAFKGSKKQFSSQERKLAAARGAATIISRLRKSVDLGSNPDVKLVAEGTKIATALTNLLEQLDDNEVGNIVQLLMKPKPTVDDLRAIMRLISVDAKLYRKAFPAVARQLSIEAPEADEYSMGQNDPETKREILQRGRISRLQHGYSEQPRGQWVDDIESKLGEVKSERDGKGSEASEASFHTAREDDDNDEYNEADSQSVMEAKVARRIARNARNRPPTLDEVADSLINAPETKRPVHASLLDEIKTGRSKLRSRGQHFLADIEADRATRRLSPLNVQLNPDLIAAAIARDITRRRGAIAEVFDDDKPQGSGKPKKKIARKPAKRAVRK